MSKCWVCGEEITSSGCPNKYRADHLPAREGNKAGNPIFNTGWVCPVCGRANAPWVGQCPCWTPKTITTTYVLQ